MLKAGQSAPPDYYSGKLASMLHGVSLQYADILSCEESSFITQYRCLSPGAQRLFARLVTRQGVLFRLDSLNYREVSSVKASLKELVAEGFLQSSNHCAADKLLRLVTKPELLALFPQLSSQHKKAECIEFIVTRYTDHAIRTRLRAIHPWVFRANQQLLRTIEILFFGKASRDFSVFVLEDLGIQTFEEYTVDANTRVFNSRRELEVYLKLLECSQYIDLLVIQWDKQLASRLELFLSDDFQHRLLERVRRVQLFRLSREAERQGYLDFALRGYQKTRVAPATERQIRINMKRGNVEAAYCLLSKILTEQGYSASEKMFASRFSHRFVNKLGAALKHKTLIPVFDISADAKNPELNQSALVLSQAPAEHIEQAVVAWYQNNDYQAWHTENGFIQAVFGLAFWEVIFHPVPGVFVNSYQSGPLDLFWPDFFQHRLHQITQCLEAIPCNKSLSTKLLAKYDEKRGVANAFVAWRSFTRSDLKQWLEKVPIDQLRNILQVMLGDIQQYRRGFPDLLVIDNKGRVKFVEVKGPGDQLSAHQRVWFNLLYKLEMPAQVLRVSW